MIRSRKPRGSAYPSDHSDEGKNQRLLTEMGPSYAVGVSGMAKFKEAGNKPRRLSVEYLGTESQNGNSGGVQDSQI